jgi:hypothetical protein
MPALGSDAVHTEGVQLLRQWIASLAGNCGDTVLNRDCYPARPIQGPGPC